MKEIQYAILATIFCFTFQSASAQLGIKAGLNLSSLKYFEDDNENNFNEEYVTGYQLGAVYVAALGEKLSFQPEAAYYTRGGKAEFGSLLGSTIVENNFQYLNLNALLNLNVLGSNDGLAVQVTAGLFGGYALSQTQKVTFSGTTTESKYNYDEDESIDRSNLGYVIGAGVRLNNLIVSLRASYGVKEYGIDSDFGSADITYKTREFSLVGAFLF